MGLVASAWHHSATKTEDVWTNGEDQRWTVRCSQSAPRVFSIMFDGVLLGTERDFGDALDRVARHMRDRRNLQ